MLENKERALAWLQALETRGVIVTLGPSGRLRLAPARAYGELSDDEALFLRHNREAIKSILREGDRYEIEAQKPAPAPCVNKAEPSSRDQPTDEERAAEIRRQLGWDQGVLNERTGYRHRE